MLRITASSYEDIATCPFRNVLDVVADKWTFLILAALEDGPKRFNAMKRLIGDISQRVLAQNLRKLERDGYISRQVTSLRPPQVQYALTDLGRELLQPVTAFMNWSAGAYPQIERARISYDGASGSPGLRAGKG